MNKMEPAADPIAESMRRARTHASALATELRSLHGALGELVYSFARVSAAVSLRVADYYTQGPRSFFRLHEKGGRYNVVPAHHTAQAYVDAYLEASGIGDDRRGPLAAASPGGAMRSRTGRCRA